ncbi:filamentous growth regulator 23-like [Sipha flava]|uniref:Filamentous growth regulator 23-like n=1 Tax=Sipha flava TaxID=143950 RepID=A0A8B8FBM5_9HEMI|nr:filamentous growth regulator 23-like [Sipha flava]
MRRSSWTFLSVALLFCALLLTVATERQDEGDDDDDDDGAHEFEEKVLRAWIEQLIKRYNKNVQSATNPTNIQRIAKKSRTSSSATGPALNHENVAPLPINSIIFNPYYHPTFYSSYIPLPYGPTTHLIPITHVSYPQQEYHHRVFIPVHAQLPYEYTQVPNIMSSTLINGHPKIKRPTNVPLHYVPSNIQDEIQDYDQAQDLDGFGQQHVTAEHAQIDQGIYDENGKPIPATRDGKLVDNINNLPSTMSTEPHQMNESQKAEFLSSTNDITMSTTPVSMTISDNPSTSEAFGDPVSQTPSDNVYRSSDKLNSTMKLLSSQSVTKEPYLIKTSEDLETTTEIVTTSSYVNNPEDESTKTEEDYQPNEPRESVDTTTDISDTSVINVENASKINNTTQTPMATTIFSALLYSMTPSAPTTLQCKNNDCSTTNSTYDMTRSVKTTKHQDLHESPVQMGSIYSSTQSASINYKQSNAISSSTRLPPTSNSEILPYTSSIMPNNVLLSLQVSEALTTLQPTFLQPFDKYNESTPTSINDTTSIQRLQSLNHNITTTTKLIETETRTTPLIKNNGQNNSKNVAQNVSILMSLDISKKHEHDASAKTEKDNFPLGLNITPSENLVSRTQTSTEKSDVLTNIEMGRYPPAIASETSSSLKPIMKSTKLFNSIQNKALFTTVSGESTYRTSANDQDRHTSGTSSLTPQTLKGSDLWYSQLYTQTPPKKELNEEQIDFLLKKLIKLLRPEIEKQSMTKDSITRFVTPKHANQEKLVYIILPWIRDTNKNVRNEERTENTTGPLKTFDKI